MRFLVIGVAVTLAACDSMFGLTPIGAPIDASVDGVPIDAPCFGNGMLSGLCVESPRPHLALTSAIDTSTDPRCRKVPQNSGPELCVIEAEQIVVSEYVYVSGERPIVLLATKDVQITSTLDLSSKLGVRVGAGAQSTCASGNGTDGTMGGSGGGAAGGAGGTFGFVGGGGGAGQGIAVPVAGGMPAALMAQTAVVGGCAGGTGGIVMNSAGVRAGGGPGGGAVYVIAGEQIMITGAINASGSGGAGGRGGTPRGGGGGGGAGGFIALDAPMLMIGGPVFARGGGGGGGGATTMNVNGGAGAEATAPANQVPGGAPAGGVQGPATGGGDGCGSPNGTIGGIPNGTAQYGGGGGGGACGRIRFYGTRSGTGVTNPAPM